MKKICILGLGYIGLPTASMFATHGFKVVGVDVVREIIETINNGDIHIVEPGLKTIVSAAVRSGNLKAIAKPEKADVFIISVPTPATFDKKLKRKKSDLSYVKAATKSIVPVLRKGNLVILESTVPPRTCENIMVPILNKSGLKPGKDYYLAHSPERVFPGQILEELVANDRIVGGYDRKSAIKTKNLYQSFVKGKIILTDCTTAEMVKLMENTYRDVNIALANELAMIAEKIGFNIWEAIQLANLHPRVNLHRPGPGVGGHCIAVDPWFIIEKATQDSHLISLSRNKNDAMPNLIVQKIKKILKERKNPIVTILGLAYKPNIDDIRESPAISVINGLKRFVKEIRIHDPFVKKFDQKLYTLEEAVRGSDLILLATNHSRFQKIDPKKIGKLMRSKRLFDAHGSLPHQKWQKSGFEVIVLGTKNIIQLVQ